ncbi:glycosyltransferase family 4 protein [Geobacillus stearothermophilus]|uniref:glycosyltransferase family 4 protein n=1 Tax=Geobacillus stearothermophilus TaxID=1422 RepID=UPI002402C29B|nr:glycosyltransferase family 1 protein [Geobacillus stearothermophilus]MDF9298573.1 glycosyltransferase family 1 protein [Geobacillus stearothermophilus]
MKKIIINGRFLTQPITGVQRFALELVRGLDELIERRTICSNVDLVIMTPRNTINDIDLKNIKVIPIGRLKGHLWEQLELPFYSRGGLLVNLCNTGPLLKRKQIVTIHDAAIYSKPEGFTKIFIYWYKFLFKILSIIACRIVTVSEFSKNELVHYCKVKQNKIRVISEGWEHIQRADADLDVFQKYNINPKKYILAVSSLNPNKNFQGIVKAIESLGNIGADIVIAGGTNPKIFSASNDSLPNTVRYIGYVTDEELKALYEKAAGFIYPSFYEGFGLPPLEAMACGCPVIVSNVASLPEVCGDAALYVDPYSPEDIAEKIKLLLSDDKLREELKRKGLERAKLFSWEKCAKETIKVIEEVLAK